MAVNLTAQEAAGNLAWQIQKQRTPARRELKEKILREERAYVEQALRINCRSIIPEQLDAAELQHLLRTQFFNAKLMQRIACLFQSMFHASNTTLLRKFLQPLQVLSDNNIMGTAMLTEWKKSISRDTALFVMKAPRVSDYLDNVNEVFISLFGTNSLRTQVPNFAYVFGAFKCSLPVVLDNQIYTYCLSPKGAYYILYENIQPNRNFRDALASMSFAEYCGYYLQLILSLKVARSIGFMHQDLHIGNVLLRTLDKTYDLHYPDGYIAANAILTFIDYGASMIRFHDRIFTDLSYFPGFTEPFPISDAHRFLCDSIVAAEPLNPLLAIQLETLLKFFTANDPKQYLQVMGKFGYQLFPTSDTKNLTLEQLQDFLHPHITARPEARFPILSCQQNACQDTLPRNLEAFDLLSWGIFSRDPKFVVTARNVTAAEYTALYQDTEKLIRNLMPVPIESETYSRYLGNVTKIQAQLQDLDIYRQLLVAAGVSPVSLTPLQEALRKLPLHQDYLALKFGTRYLDQKFQRMLPILEELDQTIWK